MSRNDKPSIEDIADSRILPYIMSKINQKVLQKHFSIPMNSDHLNISFKDSRFSTKHSKRGTARVVINKECGIANSFTLETSFCGQGNNEEGVKNNEERVDTEAGVQEEENEMNQGHTNETWP